MSFGDVRFERHPHGVFMVDGEEIAHTLLCPHCGTHFVSRQHSGHRRTFCTKCMAVTCGSHACDTCIPYEKQMSMIEANWKRINHA